MGEGQKRSFKEVDDDQAEIDVRLHLNGSVEQQELRRQNQGKIVIMIGEENSDGGDDYSEHRNHNHQHQHQLNEEQQHQYLHNNVCKRMKVSVRSLDSNEKLKIFYKVFDTVNKITQSAESSGQDSDYSSINSIDDMSDGSLSPTSSFSSVPCRSVNFDSHQHNELLKKREIVSALLQKFCTINGQ